MTLPENTEIVKEGQNEEGQDLYFIRQIGRTGRTSIEQTQ